MLVRLTNEQLVQKISSTYITGLLRPANITSYHTTPAQHKKTSSTASKTWRVLYRSPKAVHELAPTPGRYINMSSTTNKKVLVLGQKIGSSDVSSEQLQAVFKDQIESAKKAGIDMRVESVDIEQAIDANMKSIRAVLQQEQWDGVCVGFGIRGTEKLTPLFEHVMNAIVQLVQPAPRLAFPLRPHLVWESICRVYDIPQ